LKELHERVWRTVSLDFRTGFFQSGKRLGLHCQISLDVSMSGVRTLVTKPQRDDVEGNARL
jgi:hypothetical protein